MKLIYEVNDRIARITINRPEATTEDAKEGPRAFAEKRKAAYKAQ
jgi:1,4-dihydroxy-2-naphthoyl-CoA synthase